MKNLSLFLTILLVFGFILSNQTTAQEFETGNLAISISDYGRLRAYTPDLAGLRQIDRSSVLLGVSSTAVFDYLEDADTEVAPYNVTEPSYSDFEVFGSFNSNYSASPPNVLAEESFMGWTGGAYCLAKFNIINSEHDPIDAVLGMEIIPYIDYTWGTEIVEYLPASASISIHRDQSYIGYRFFYPEMTSLAIFEWFDGYNESDDALWNWMTQGSIDDYYQAGVEGSVLIPGFEAVNILANEAAEMYFAVSYGTSEAEMLANLDLAEEEFNENFLSVGTEPVIQPANFTLDQNYPNPFNPATAISFSLESSEQVSLKVFNTSGQEIAVLIDGEMNTGNHTIEFDASNLTSGLYFYTLSVDGINSTKKMLLLK